MRILFADEARFGRINRPRPCWAPIKNYALKSIDAVRRATLEQAILYIDRNPETVKSITLFPLYGALKVKD